MKKINIDHLLDVLQQCKKEGCKEVLFTTGYGKDGSEEEINLTILQDDYSVIFSTTKMNT